jgi:hypothetical protein
MRDTHRGPPGGRTDAPEGPRVSPNYQGVRSPICKAPDPQTPYPWGRGWPKAAICAAGQGTRLASRGVACPARCSLGMFSPRPWSMPTACPPVAGKRRVAQATRLWACHPAGEGAPKTERLLPCGGSGGLKSTRLAIWAIWAGRPEGPLPEHRKNPSAIGLRPQCDVYCPVPCA